MTVNCQIRKFRLKIWRRQSVVALMLLIFVFCTPCFCWVDVSCVASKENPLTLMCKRVQAVFRKFLQIVCHVLVIVNSSLISLELPVFIFFFLFSLPSDFFYTFFFIFSTVFFFNYHRFSLITGRCFDPWYIRL